MYAKSAAVAEIPRQAAGSVEVKGVLRLRLCFVSRSTTFAQDDSLFGHFFEEKNE
jgi:hypothetical protein